MGAVPKCSHAYDASQVNRFLFQFLLGFVEGDGALFVQGDGGDQRAVQHPFATQYPVVGIAAVDAEAARRNLLGIAHVTQLLARFLLQQGGVYINPFVAEEQPYQGTAATALLVVALGKGGGIGKVPVVEYVVAVGKQTFRLDAAQPLVPFAVVRVPEGVSPHQAVGEFASEFVAVRAGAVLRVVASAIVEELADVALYADGQVAVADVDSQFPYRVGAQAVSVAGAVTLPGDVVDADGGTQLGLDAEAVGMAYGVGRVGL